MDTHNNMALLSLKDINSIWRKVLHLAIKRTIKKGDTWSGVRDHNNSMMFLETGSVTLSSLTTKGRERVSIHFESGCLLGETPLFSRIGDKSSISLFTAKEDCIVYAFPADLVSYDFIAQYPDLMYNLMETSASKVAYLFALLSDRNGESSREIICKHLVRLVNKHNSLCFAPLFTKEEFALSLGMHRSTVFRIFKELHEEGTVSVFKKKSFEIYDIEKIKQYAYDEDFR